MASSRGFLWGGLWRLGLLLEILVCFAPLYMYWILGWIAVGFFVFPSREMPWADVPVVPAIYVLCGFVGLVTLFVVLLQVLIPPLRIVRGSWLLFGVAIGMAPTIIMSTQGLPWDDGTDWFLSCVLVFLPMLGSGHLIYLARDFVLK